MQTRGMKMLFQDLNLSSGRPRFIDPSVEYPGERFAQLYRRRHYPPPFFRGYRAAKVSCLVGGLHLQLRGQPEEIFIRRNEIDGLGRKTKIQSVDQLERRMSSMQLKGVGAAHDLYCNS